MSRAIMIKISSVLQAFSKDLQPHCVGSDVLSLTQYSIFNTIPPPDLLQVSKRGPAQEKEEGRELPVTIPPFCALTYAGNTFHILSSFLSHNTLSQVHMAPILQPSHLEVYM